MPKAVFCQTLCYQKSARVTNGTFLYFFYNRFYGLSFSAVYATIYYIDEC